MEARILGQFRAIVGRGLITEASQLHTYECDGLTNFRVMPQAVLEARPAQLADDSQHQIGKSFSCPTSKCCLVAFPGKAAVASLAGAVATL
jgi:hypothetical protein